MLLDGYTVWRVMKGQAEMQVPTAALRLLWALEARGIRLRQIDGRLRVEEELSTVTAAERESLAVHEHDIVTLITHEAMRA